jgi:hypothetical protein
MHRSDWKLENAKKIIGQVGSFHQLTRFKKKS